MLVQKLLKEILRLIRPTWFKSLGPAENQLLEHEPPTCALFEGEGEGEGGGWVGLYR